MNTLSVQEMTTIEGGDFIDGVCAGFGIGAAVHTLGGLAIVGWWNPVGAGLAAAYATVAIGCGVYYIAS